MEPELATGLHATVPVLAETAAAPASWMSVTGPLLYLWRSACCTGKSVTGAPGCAESRSDSRLRYALTNSSPAIQCETSDTEWLDCSHKAPRHFLHEKQHHTYIRTGMHGSFCSAPNSQAHPRQPQTDCVDSDTSFATFNAMPGLFLLMQHPYLLCRTPGNPIRLLREEKAPPV